MMAVKMLSAKKNDINRSGNTEEGNKSEINSSQKKMYCQ